MRNLNVFIHSLLLATIPSLLVYPQEALPQFHEDVKTNTQDLSYDQIIHLLEEIESGKKEHASSLEEIEKINQFIALLAKEGALPEDSEENISLEEDIEELLNGEDHAYAFAFSFGQDEYLVLPGMINGDEEVILCKSWAKKRWKHTRKFIKKHKKAIIIGAAVVVAATVVVAVVAASSATAAAASAAAAGAASSSSDKPPKRKESSNVHSSSTDDVPHLKSAIDEQISSFKENIVKEQFFQSNKELPLEENGRALGSVFAHESFTNLNNQIADYPRLAQEIQTIGLHYRFSNTDGHPEIDRRFSTDYAPLYASPDKETSFDMLAYQVRGESALTHEYYAQAVHDFGKAIESNPSNPIPYLERGVAHFGLGQYQHSLDDYHQFAQAQKNQPLSVSDFSLGFAKGLPKGIYESGRGILVFLSDIITHPIHTGGQMWDALTLLNELALSEQWSTLSEVLAPEVHQLVRDWDSLPSDTKGELAGYAFGKYGSDILIPGALAKAVSKGLKVAQELSTVYRGLKTAEHTLLLESISGLESSTKIAEAVYAGQTITLGEELGFTAREMVELKQAGNLEVVVSQTFEDISKNPITSESLELFKRAEDFLKPYRKLFMEENQVRELIHGIGIRTFPRPKGIPENYRIRISKHGAGMLYVHPEHTHTSIRVMPGKPHSCNPAQQKPYVIYIKNGKTLDKFGNIVDSTSPEAHILLEEFLYLEDPL